MRYAVRRLALSVPTLFGLSVIIFLLGALSGDPSGRIAERGLPPGEVPTAEQIAAVHHELGLDRPLPTRYGEWLGHAVRGDLGRSLITGLGVGSSIRKAVGPTLSLALVATFFVVAAAIPLALLGSTVGGKWFPQVIRVLSLGGASIPSFFLAYVLIYLFSVRLHLFPVVGQSGFRSIVLPALTLAVGPAAIVARLLQTAIVDQRVEEYARTARSKGLREAAVVSEHVLPNALLSVVTVVGSLVARLLEGAVVVELIFGRSGIGALTLQAVGSADYPLIQGVVLLGGCVVILFNLLVDLAYPGIDPRIRLLTPR